jgi:2-amino-4-hydroxy-6-hydroxymethyldihydropteridine diphosphokinase
MAVIGYVGLGSNLGSREAHIEAALGEMARAEGIRVRRRSPLYETDPVGGPPQGKYLNGVAELEVEIPAEDLLAALLEIERRLGRERRVRWGPRVIDLDLLLYGEEVRRGPDLVLPHPRLREREFVLRPLADLRRDLPVPPDGVTVGDLLEAAEGGRTP